jgi:hypothetical protein
MGWNVRSYILTLPVQVTYLNSGGEIGDVLKAVVTCDKCEYYLGQLV